MSNVPKAGLALLILLYAAPGAAIELCFCKAKDISEACRKLCDANPGQDTIGRSVPPPGGPIINPFKKQADDMRLQNRQLQEQAIRGAAGR